MSIVVLLENVRRPVVSLKYIPIVASVKANGEPAPPILPVAAGEKRELQFTATAATGSTITLSQADPPTFQLFQDGVPVARWSTPQPVGAYDTAAAASVNATYLLDTTSLAPGVYLGSPHLAIVETGDVFRPEFLIEVGA